MTNIVGPDGEQSTAVAVSPSRQLVSRIRGDEFKEQVRMVLPPEVTPDRFVRATVTALLQNPDLAQKADHDTIFSAVLRSAQDGLLPDGREAAIVLFGRKATYMPMISGFRKVAAESGWTIRTQVVYENDEFDYSLGLEPALVHKPVRIGAERGRLVAAYAIGAHRDGRKEIEVLTARDIEKVRASSRSKDSGPWRDWTERMWEKTAGRRLFAKLPLGEREYARVERMLETPELEPEEALAMLYGPQDTDRRLAELAQASHEQFVEGELVDKLPEDAGPPDEDGGGVSSIPPESTLPPSEPETLLDQPAVSDSALLRKARATRPPKGSHAEMTLAQILRLEPLEGARALYPLLGEFPESEPMFGRLLWALVRVERPELATEVEGG